MAERSKGELNLSRLCSFARWKITLCHSHGVEPVLYRSYKYSPYQRLFFDLILKADFLYEHQSRTHRLSGPGDLYLIASWMSVFLPFQTISVSMSLLSSACYSCRGLSCCSCHLHGTPVSWHAINITHRYWEKIAQRWLAKDDPSNIAQILFKRATWSDT